MSNTLPRVQTSPDISGEAKWLISRLGRSAGLPSSQLHHSALGRNGLLFLATPAGLGVFDGVSVTMTTMADGLACNGLRWIDSDASGGVWIGSDVGFDYVDAAGVVDGPEPAMQPGLVTSGLVDGDGCWLASASGLCRVERVGREISLTRYEMSDTILLLGCDGRGTPLAADANDILHSWDGSSWAPLKHGGYKNCGALRVIVPDGPDTLLIGGADGFCRIHRNGDLLSFVGTSHFGGPVTALLRRDDDVLAAIGSNLVVFATTGAVLVPIHRLASVWSVTDLRMDRYRNVWGTTNSHGLLRISGLERFVRFADIPDIGAVFAIRQRRSGALALGGENGILVPSRTNGDVSYRHLLPGVRCWDVLETRIGETIAATDDGVVVVDSMGVGAPLVPRNPDLAERSRVLLQRSDELWVGTIKGLFRVQNSRVTTVTDADGASLGYVYSLRQGSDGRLWAATLGRGLWHETDDGFVQFTSAPIPVRSNVYATDEADDGRIAIIMESSVVLGRRGSSPGEWMSDEWRVVPLGAAGWALKFSDGDQLLVGTSDGLKILDSRSGETIRSVRPVLGLENWEFMSSRSLAYTGGGRWMCGVTIGLIEVDTSGLEAISDRPIPFVARVDWSGADEHLDGDVMVVETGNWTMELTVRSDWRVDETDCTFSCRIEGFDTEWTRSSRSGEFRYTSLPAGEYTIRGCVLSPLVGEGPATELMKLRVVPRGEAK